MAFRVSGKTPLLIAAALLLVCIVPQSAWAGTIQIYGIADHYRHKAYPCIFAGNDGCNSDPAGWPAPTGSTSNDWGNATSPLLQDYIGGDFTAWNTIVGSTFVLGLDFNTSSAHQSLQTLSMTFYNGATLLETWTLTVPTGGLLTPDIHNGDGYPDYVFAAGCAGTTAGITGFGAYSWLQSCTQYTPFTTPAGTTRIDFAFLYTGANDGDEDLYAIKGAEAPLPEVPEPATLLLLSTGLFVTAWRLRRRV